MTYTTPVVRVLVVSVAEDGHQIAIAVPSHVRHGGAATIVRVVEIGASRDQRLHHALVAIAAGVWRKETFSGMLSARLDILHDDLLGTLEHHLDLYRDAVEAPQDEHLGDAQDERPIRFRRPLSR